ncbi:MAG: ABC transporter ATP-binding protein [Nanoarchaeota archaeon]|nr:ABC transporter ATP-binding protein [Nanoarchaeota archaeon]
MKTILELADVWKIYKMGDVEVPALKGLDFKVGQGEFVAIMGPSGSGKSTAMNMIGCLDVPTRGHIFLEGKDIALMSESQLARIRGKKIGFIFQQFNLINTLTALENVALPMVFQNIPKEKRLAKARQLLELVELGERMHHKPTELSGGQQQRVAIARSLANDPEVILADEPTGNLDSKTGHTVMDFLRKLHEKEGRTIILVTHDEATARNADRIEFLKDGQVLKREKR